LGAHGDLVEDRAVVTDNRSRSNHDAVAVDENGALTDNRPVGNLDGGNHLGELQAENGPAVTAPSVVSRAAAIEAKGVLLGREEGTQQ
jgi:hypothetical protein